MRAVVPIAALALSLLAACSDSGASRLDAAGDGAGDATRPANVTRVSVLGEYCPAGAGTSTSGAAPVRLLLLLDRSQSALVNDPGDLWTTAIKTLAAAHETSGDVAMSVIVYGGAASDNPGLSWIGFVAPRLLATLDPGPYQGWDDLEGAIGAARTLLVRDIEALPAAQRARTRYIVHIITDGGVSPQCVTGCEPVFPATPAPHPYDVVCNLPRSMWCAGLGLGGVDCALLETQLSSLEQCKARNTLASLYYAMQALSYQIESRGSRFDLRIAHMQGPDGDPAAKGRLAQLAQATRSAGTVTRYSSASELDLTRFELTPPDAAGDVRETALLAVDHALALDDQGRLVVDSDADGVGDDDELRRGTDPRRRDSNNDGIGDGVARRLGSASGALCSADERLADLDADGLNDCEERLLGTEPARADTDGDGVPDGIEVLYGLDPVSASDGIDELHRRLGQRALPNGDTGCVQMRLEDVARRSDSSRLAIYVIGGSGSPTGHRLLGAACPAASATSVTLRDGNTLPLATLRQQSNASGVSPCAP
ncbi:MAG: hypothetical protein KC503_45525 [Myxococcales bacterium]|nr:hypothetical protein [Myxococcales bacterium]